MKASSGLGQRGRVFSTNVTWPDLIKAVPAAARSVGLSGKWKEDASEGLWEGQEHPWRAGPVWKGGQRLDAPF